MRKAWHIIDESKCQYFLVNILPHQPDSTKIPIQYQRVKYFVKEQQLLPYSSQKTKNLYDIQENNTAQIVNWLKEHFQAQGYWLKLSKKLVFDFNNNTQRHRQEFMRFIIGRFLVGQKDRQYLCVSKDYSMHNTNKLLTQTLFHTMEKGTNIWNYKISLSDLCKIYGIFFRDIATKLKIFVKDDQIIKMTINPYDCFSRQMLGTQGSGYLMNLTGRIFNVMAASKRQVKNYYRVPYKAVPTSPQTYTLEELTNFLIQIGLKVNEVKQIISIFSLIVNINYIELARGRKDEGSKFKIRQGTMIKQNFQHLIGNDLLQLFEIELNSFPNNVEPTIQNVKLKQQLLIRVLYQQIILKVAQILNQKMCNISATFEDYKQFIVLEFPTTQGDDLSSLEDYYVDVVNRHVQAIGLDLPFSRQAYDKTSANLYKQLKEQNNYDINKGILAEMHKTLEWLKQTKKCEFIQTLKIERINCINHQGTRQRVGKIQDLYEQLQNLRTNKQYFANFVIQTSVNERNIPIHKKVLSNLHESIRQARQPKQIRVKSPRNKPYQAIVNEQQEQFEDNIQIKLKVFFERYTYCQLLKKLNKQKQEQTLNDQLKKHFKSHQQQGKVTQDEKKVLLSVDFYQKMEQQRMHHQRSINKIKNQLKRVRFRHSIFTNLKGLYGKIKFNTFIKNKIVSFMKDPFMLIKKASATSRICEITQKPVSKIEKHGLKQIKLISGIKILDKVLKEKETIGTVKKHFFKNLKREKKIYRGKQLATKIVVFTQAITLRRKRQAFKKLNQEYQIVVNPPQSQANYTSAPISPKKTAQIKKQPPVSKNNVQTAQSLPNQNNYASVPLGNHDKPRPKQQEIFKDKKDSTLPNPKKQQEPPAEKPAKKQKDKASEPNTDRYNSSYNSNDNSSFGNSTNRGIQKSEVSRKMAQHQFLSMKDHPKFSLQIWMKQAVGFQKRKPAQAENTEVAKDLFNKRNEEKPPHKEPPQELNVDILIKQKVVINPFFPYLMENIAAQSQQKMQKIMSHQAKVIKQPLLSLYPKQKFSHIPPQTFNNILKIGLDKNTSRPREQLINAIVKPIKQTYHSQKSNISTVFQGEPAIIGDYSWDHNIIKDQIFMQIIKQVMMNQKQESLHAIADCLEIITRYCYPSPRFLYPFLHFLKSLQSKNIEKLNQCFVNTLLFAQVYERYKGSNVTVLKEEIFPKEKQSHPCLEPRLTPISKKEIEGCLAISLRFINDETYEYIVRNQTLSHFKRKVLKEINLLNYEQYFGVYYSFTAKGNHAVVNQSKKAIDFLNEYPQTKNQHLLYIKLKYYFPFNIKQVNKTRLMYLNSIYEQRNLPWKAKDYQSIVVLSMLFDQFQEQRISNYLIMTNQVQGDVDLAPIQNKYTQVANSRGKKICEIEYFKEVKQCGFLGAKAYRIKDQTIETFLTKFSKVIIKPLQLCFYSGQELKSSIGLKRIRGFGLEKGQLQLQLDYTGEDSHRSMRNLTLKGIERMNEFHADLAAYMSYLNPN